MPIAQLSDILPSLGTVIDPRLSNQWVQSAVGLSFCPVVAGSGPATYFDLGFFAKTAASFLEGSDPITSDFVQNQNVKATLQFARYRTSFGLTDWAITVAKSSGGTPDALRELWKKEMDDSVTALAHQANVDFYVGDGSGAGGSIVGLNSIINGATYAGQSRSSFPQWASNIVDGYGQSFATNGRSLMRALEAKIYTNSMMKPDLILCDVNTYALFESVFDPIVRITDTNSANVGLTNLTFQGIPVVRDVSCPAGDLYMLNRSVLELRPQMVVPEVGQLARFVASGGNGMGVDQTVGVPILMDKLAKTGDSSKGQAVLNLQLVCRRPNAIGMIKNIA